MAKKKGKKGKKKDKFDFGLEDKKKKKGKKKGKKGKESKKDKTVKAEKPKYKRVKVSLKNSEAKESKKEVKRPVKVSKKFLENREKCNHADGTISPDEYRKMSRAPDAYTPELEDLIEVFGEEHVHVCACCYQAVVDRESVEVDKVYSALQYLRAACGVVTSNYRMKKDEIKKVNKLRAKLAEFEPLMDILEEIEGRDDGESGGGDGNLDRNDGGRFIG